MQITFEFIGGPRDGERLTGWLEDGALCNAVGFYRHTRGARVGARFWCTCEYSVTALRTLPYAEIELLESAGYQFPGHVYEVVERREAEGTICARARHVFASE